MSGSPGNPANRVPNSPDDDVQRQLRALRQEITELKRGRNQQIFVLDQTQTFPLARIGYLPDEPRFNNPVTGNRQLATEFRRDDGTLALTIEEGAADIPGDPYNQSVAIWDRSGNIIVSEDSDSGFGHARPHVPGPFLTDTNTAMWWATSNTSATTVASGFMEIQQPVLAFQFQILTPPSGTAQFGLLLNGTDIAVHNSAANIFDSWADTVDLSAAAGPLGLSYGDLVTLEVQARISSGSGTVKIRQMWLSGYQSLN